MKAVGFTLDNFDFVINRFQFTGMDGIFTMLQDAITMSTGMVPKNWTVGI